jgi:hypothetical protein
MSCHKEEQNKRSDLQEVVDQISQVKLTSDDATESSNTLDSLYTEDFLFSPEFVAQVGEE